MNRDAYYSRVAAAFVRGCALQGRGTILPDRFSEVALDELTEADCAELVELGRAAGLSMRLAKRTMEVPRVRRTLGLLRSLGPVEVLDLGSGRGVSLWPMMEAFPDIEFTATDQRRNRVDDLAAVASGGFRRLHVQRIDARDLSDFGDGQFDVVTVLETLEHIADADRAFAEASRVARRAIVASTPTKEDDNPDHVRVFTEGDMRGLARQNALSRVSFQYAVGSRIVLFTK
ncbi:MAG: class I SAM-dependent methyltransferase [Pirellulaceae bacterium]|jgi:2-polyprenyl-3-methyl-5-hydroxy-6-metoxy-1,4-benzoquinol methylase|nr:class I SAM-dependent methyltransferase [Pirellulaceae bacterium]